jgi:hypothetical protein
MGNSIEITSNNSKNVQGAPWDVITVFGYGETQLTNRRESYKIENGGLTSLTQLLEYVSSLKNDGLKFGLSDIHSLIIINNNYIKYVSKPKNNEHSKSQEVHRFLWDSIDPSKIENLFVEMSAMKPSNTRRFIK